METEQEPTAEPEEVSLHQDPIEHNWVYKSSYAVSYGVVFMALFIAKALPQSAKTGMADGAESARARVSRKCKHRS